MTKISDERIEEMLAGLEGVASGPWYHVKGRGKFHLGWEVGSPDDAVSASPKAEVSAHISRCDPDTIRSILTELQSLRAHNSDSAEPVAWTRDGCLSLLKEHWPMVEVIQASFEETPAFNVPLYLASPPAKEVIDDGRWKRIYDALAKEGGGTWATYMMIDIEALTNRTPDDEVGNG